MTALRSINASGLLADAPRLLRVALRLDAVVTGVNGLAYLALAKPLESFMGLDVQHSLVMGAFLTLYAIGVWVVSMPAAISKLATSAVVEANVLWAVLSVVAVVTGFLSLNAVGNVWAVMQAGTVAGFAALQYAALRKTP